MAASPISKEAEDKLIAASSAVAALVANGSLPNDAMCKVAQDYQLPRGHIPLLARAYNVAATAHRLASGADAYEKSADFPIADSDAVAAVLFPEKVASAPDLDFYYGGPPVRVKKAAVPSPEDEAIWQMYVAKYAAPAVEISPKEAWRDAIDKIAAAEKNVERISLDAYSNRMNIERTLNGLDRYFKTAGALAWTSVRRSADLKWGHAVTGILDYIADTSPVVKRAGDTSPYHAVDVRAEPYKSLLAVVSLVRKQAELAEFERGMTKAAETLADEAIAEADAVSYKAASHIGAGLQYAAAGRLFDSLIPPEEKQYRRATESFDDPEHQQELREIRARAGIHELFADPVIGGHSPGDIADAYNPISEAAPVASGQSLFARALLRKSLAQGSLDSFDVDSIGKAEGVHRDLHQSNRDQNKSSPLKPIKAIEGGRKSAANLFLD